MAAPQFSSDSSFPIPQKPFTSPTDVDTHRDVFAVYNSFRKLFGKLDGEFAAVYDALSYKLGDAPMDGKQYARKDGNWEEVTGGGGGGGGALEFMKEVVVSTATTDIIFSGLDADADEMYQLEIYGRATGATNYVYLYYNTDFTGANYRISRLISSTAVSAQQTSDALALNLGDVSGAEAWGNIQIRKTAGKVPVAFGNSIGSTVGGGLTIFIVNHLWTASTNVNTITLRSSTTFGVGTKARLYRLRKDNAAGMLPPYMDPKTGAYWIETFSRGLGASSTVYNFDSAQPHTTYFFNGGSRAYYTGGDSVAGLTLITGTNANGGARHFFGAPAIRIGGGEIRFKAVVTLNQAMTAAQDGFVSVGLLDLITGAPVARVNAQLSFASNSYCWQLLSYTAGVPTTVNTVVAAPAAGVKTAVELVVNAAGTQADLYIAGVLAGSVATNISILLSPAVMFIKSAGTTSCSATLHYAEFKKVYTTPLP